MRFVVDVKQEDGRTVVETSAGVKSIHSAHHQIVDPDKVGEAAGAVIQRILDRRPETVAPPDGKKMVRVGIGWMAFSVVEVAVPEDVSNDDALREAIRVEITGKGLPEVILNETMTFVEALNAYAPAEEDGHFEVCPETEIDID